MLGFVFGCCFFFFNFFFSEFIFFLAFFSLFIMSIGCDFGSVESFFSFFDSLSQWLVLLSFWIVGLCLMGSPSYFKEFSGNFFFLLYVFIVVSLIVSFSIKSIIGFYFSFESSLIPVFMVIVGWGYQPERLQAGLYLLFYTLGGSLPLFCCILWLSEFGFFSLPGLNFIDFSFLVILFFVGGFLIKLPMYGVHLWLLKAHVEAPVSGSMILAGVMLKLGGYGLLRFMVLWDGLILDLFVFWGVWGGFLMGVQCLRIMDMKLLVAASSVVHMGFCVSCIFYSSSSSVGGVIMMMLAHGLCSSGLFYLCGLVYSLFNSRSLYVCKGLVSIMPSFTIWWFVLCISNMGAPPSLNLLAELIMICSLISFDFFLIIPLCLMSFFSAAYSLFLYSVSQHSSKEGGWRTGPGGSMSDHLVIILHWLPVNIFFFVSFFFC